MNNSDYEKYKQQFDDAVIKINDLIFIEIYEIETGFSLNTRKQTSCCFCGSGDNGAGSTPAFTYYPSSNMGKCFSCGESTSTVGFIMFFKNLKYKEAIHYISKYYLHNELINPYENIRFPTSNTTKKISERKKITEEEKKKEEQDNRNKFNFLKNLIIENQDKTEAKNYLQKRSFNTEIITDDFYYQANKYNNLPCGVVFFDTEERLLNKRYCTNELPEGVSKSFNRGQLVNSVFDKTFKNDEVQIHITEGVLNALSLYQEGKSSIALFATTNNISDVAKFEKYFHDKEIIIAYDNDRAGLQGAIKLGNFIIENFAIRSLKMILFPSKKDANDLLQKSYLHDFLENHLNYISLKKDILTTELHKIKENIQYIPQIAQNNYSVRKKLENENPGFIYNIQELTEEIIEKLRGSELLSKLDFQLYKIDYLENYSEITEKWVHTHSSIEKDPIFIIDKKVIWRPFANKKQNFKELIFVEEMKNWIFGIDVLRQRAAEIQKEYEIAELPDEDSDNKKKGSKKQAKYFPYICLCYSIRDAINIYASSTDFYPIYLPDNLLDYDLYQEFDKDADCIIQFPSKSQQDRQKAKLISLQHIDIKTFNIPRDNYAKNLSEFLKYTKIDWFKRLLNTALPVKFWEWENKDYTINSIKLNYFLNINGYFTYKSPSNKAGYIYILINGKIVNKIDPDKENFSRMIKTFIDNYLEHRGENTKLRSKIMKSSDLNENNLSTLRELELDTDNSGKSYQNWFFKDGNMWTVTRNGIKKFEQHRIKKYVWDDELLDMPSDVLANQFEIKYTDEYLNLKKQLDDFEYGSEEWRKINHKIQNFKTYDKYDIEIYNRKNYFLQFLWLTSYAYCDEVEELGIKINKEDFWYNLKDVISDSKIKEMKLHLINKLTWLGYFMRDHRKLSDDYGLAIIDAVDNNPRIRKKGSAGGGKSIITKAIARVKRTMIVPAEKEDFANDKHRYELYNNEKVIVCDDMHQYAKIGDMLTDFSEGIEVNPKHKRPTKIPFIKSPKIIVTRNYIDDEGERVDRRLGRIFVFPFFHDGKSGRHKVRRKPEDVFGRQLFDEDTEYDKKCLVNLFANCYIANQIFEEINPPMDDLETFRIKKRIGEPLIEFCDNYFETNGYGYIDRVWLFKQFQETMRPVMNNFERTNLYGTSQKFLLLITDYCKLNDLIFNPEELINDKKNGRIMYYSKERVDNSTPPKSLKCEHFYINTKEDFKNEINQENKEEINNKLEEDPFGPINDDLPF